MSNRTPGPFEEKIEDVAAAIGVSDKANRVYPQGSYMEWTGQQIAKLAFRFGEVSAIAIGGCTIV
jgi:hypothetical protein